MPYIEFPATPKGQKDRMNFYLSEDGITLVKGWRREGIAIDEIALKYIGIGTTTMTRWRQKSKEFNDALRVSQDINNAQVEEALLKRALGYEYDEDTWELIEGTLRKTKTVRKHVSPDVKACLSWLFSRRPDRWRAIQDPVDDAADDINKAKKILVAIKEVADGNGNPAQSEAD